MLIVHPVQAGQARYYLDSEGAGQWVGGGTGRLGLVGGVRQRALCAVLAGQDPRAGRHQPLLRRIPSGRRAGFDAVFAAPKSVSLLAALASSEDGARLVRAHELAVQETLGFLERTATWTRRGADHRRIPTSGLVATAFTHGTSRTGDPHLHTHVVVANLVEGADGRWSCVDSRSLYRHAPAASAIYQASLRRQIARQGLAVSWELRAGGLADVRGVPREAIDSCSLRRRQIEREVGRAGADSAGVWRVAAGRTRRQAQSAPADSWQERAARAGLGRDRAAAVLRAGSRLALHPAPPAPGAIERVLIERSSWFGRADTVRAVAGLLPDGAPARTVERWADEFLAAALAIGDDRWTTPTLKRLEAQVVTAARDNRCEGVLAARPDAIAIALGRRPELGPAGRAAVRRVTSGTRIDLVAGTDLIGTAAVLDAARAAWEASGHRVAIRSPRADGRTAARWQALAGLDPPPGPPRRATVLIVDQADRASTADLHRILSDGLARHSKVVLIDGGSRAGGREPASPAFEGLRKELATIAAPREAELALTRTEANEVIRAGRDQAVALAPTHLTAAAGLVADWARASEGAGPASARPVMVALGPAEAEYLNAAARAHRQAIGRLAGPAVRAGGREFQVGDEVRALRRRPEFGRVAAGTTGQVTSVDPDGQRLTIRWPAGTSTLSAKELPRSAVSHAYATTPVYARRHPGPVLALGDVRRLAPGLDPTVTYCLAPEPSAPNRSPAQTALGRLLAELGTAGPAGPAPSMPPAEAGRSLSSLVSERNEIAARLLASAPPDTGGGLRRLAEERAWVDGVPDRPDRLARLAELDRREAPLLDQAGHRAAWAERHREVILRGVRLEQAIQRRQAALGRGAEILPPRAVIAALGPAPEQDTPARRAWRQAAEAIEVHRECRGLPDEPLALDHGHADDRRVIAACRAVDRARTAALEIDLSPAAEGGG